MPLMRAWMSPDVPQLPGSGSGRVLVHDTLTGRLQPAGPETGEARLYACGITPYDATHLGHAATYVGVDLLLRAWLDAGLGVRYAQNVTDVDDPLLERAEATGVDWAELAAEQVELYRSDMTALRVLPPHRLTGVVESLEVVTDLIGVLRDEQAVYQVPDPAYPDWYFAVTKASNLMVGTGISLLEAEQVFAERGGRDLAFPHHPMCAAEARIATGRPMAKLFLHSGMVGLDGEKMSKSLGNLVFVSRLLADDVDPMAIRLVLLAHHYRGDWEYTAAALAQAQARLDAWRAAASRPSGPDATATLDEVRTALRTDLDAPAALAAIDAWAASEGDDVSAPGLIRDLADALLGIAL